MSDTIYTIASFLESSDQKIRAFTEAVEKNTWESVLRKTENTIPDITIDTGSLDSMVRIGMHLGVEANEVADYLSTQDVHDYLAKNPTTVKLHTKYLDIPINVSGLKNFKDDIRKLFEDISTEKKGMSDVKAWINDPRVITKYKRKINGTASEAYRTSKDVLKPLPTDDILLDRGTITGIQNSLYKFSKIYASSYVGKKDETDMTNISFKHGSVIIKTVIKKNYDDIQSYIAAAMKSSIPKAIVGQLTYSSKVMYAELCKYTIASYLQFMSERIHEVRTLISLSSQLKESLKATGLTEEMESVCTDPLNYTMDDSDLIIDCIDKTINDMKISGVTKSETIDYYDKRAYDLPVELLSQLSEALKEAEEFYREKYADVSVGLIIRRFDLKNENLWRTLVDNLFDKNKSVEFIRSDPSLAVNDLIHMRSSLMSFKNYIKTAMTNLAKLIHTVNTVGDDTYGDHTGMVELTDWIGNQLNTIYRESAKKFVDRLNMICGIVFPRRDFTATVVCDTHNYFIDAFNANYDAMEESFQENLQHMNHAYYEAYLELALAPKYYFEVGETAATVTQNNQQDNSNSSNTNDSNKKPSTTPKVTENTGNDASSEPQNNANSGNNGESNKTPISGRISNFIQNVIDKITGFFNKNGAKKKNLGFIQTYENYLNTRSYANVSLQMLPYIQIDYIATLKGIIDKAARMNANQLKSMDETSLYNYIYADTQFARVKGDNPNARFEQAIKIGINKNEVVTYSNNAIKKMIPGMSTYVKNYYTNIINDLEGIKKSLKPLDNLNSFKSSGNADDRTNANIALIPRIVNNAIGSCINVTRQRANDYMVVMDSLVSKQEKDKTKNTQPQNDQATNNNQNTDTANNQ